MHAIRKNSPNNMEVRTVLGLFPSFLVDVLEDVHKTEFQNFACDKKSE